MKGFGEFAKILERGAATCHERLALNLHAIGMHQQVVAAELIGHELPQWPPLAESTVAEKQRLCYTGHISATDPLLRTGANRDSIDVSVNHAALTEVTGSKRIEFLWMEIGTANANRSIPPRPSLAIAAAGSLPFAGDKLVETAVYVLTGETPKIANNLPPGLIKK